MVIAAVFLTITYSLITFFLDSYLFLLYSLNNISEEWLLQHELTDEALIFGFKRILSFHIKGLNHHNYTNIISKYNIYESI